MANIYFSSFIEKEYSSQSSDSLVRVLWSVQRILEIHGVPLVVVVVHVVNVTMNNWLTNVKEEEHWYRWIHESSEISR